MRQENVNIFYRIFIFPFYCFFRVWFSGAFARAVQGAVVELKEQKQQAKLEKSGERDTDAPSEDESDESEVGEEEPSKKGQESSDSSEREPLRLDYPREDPAMEERIGPPVTSSGEEPASESVSTQNAEPTVEVVDGMHLLSMLQREGRLVDFLQQDISKYQDDEVGAAVRVIHSGCKQVLEQYFTLAPIRTEEEESEITLEEYDPQEVELGGNVGGEPPYSGELVHHGWKVVECRLPKVTHLEAKSVIYPAQIDVD